MDNTKENHPDTCKKCKIDKADIVRIKGAANHTQKKEHKTEVFAGLRQLVGDMIWWETVYSKGYWVKKGQYLLKPGTERQKKNHVDFNALQERYEKYGEHLAQFFTFTNEFNDGLMKVVLYWKASCQINF